MARTDRLRLLGRPPAIAGTLALAASLAGGLVGLALAGGDPAPPELPPPLDAGPSATAVSVLDAPAGPPDVVRVPVRPLDAQEQELLAGMARTDQARLAAVQGDLSLYLAPAQEPGSVCLVVTGATDGTFAVSCPSRRVVAAGRAFLAVRGGPGQPQTVVGIVPDVVAAVSDGTVERATPRNVVVFAGHPRGAQLRFRLVSRTERVVRKDR